MTSPSPSTTTTSTTTEGGPPPASSFLRRHRGALGGVALSVLVIALVWLASVPTGTDSATQTVPNGSRLAARSSVADVEVLVVSTHGALSVKVAYPTSKGWLSADLRKAPTNAVAAWAGTRGQGAIPALAVVYGRAPGPTVEIRWADGERTRVRTASDGVYVATREGYVASRRVRVLDATGGTLLDIEGPS